MSQSQNLILSNLRVDTSLCIPLAGVTMCFSFPKSEHLKSESEQ